MSALIESLVERPRTAIAAWLVVLAAVAPFSLQLDDVIRGSTDGIPGSPSDNAILAVNRHFGPDSGFVFPVVVESDRASVDTVEFARTVAQLERAMMRNGNAADLRHYWNSGASELLGADRRSALLLVSARAATFHEAESRVPRIRADIRAAGVPSGFSAKVTGPVAVFHDTNRHSADDLLAAERVGLPVTLLILLVVFGAPLAAGLPLLVAFAAVLLSLATLFALGHWLPISVFARNAVTMIGLGVGVDYALFLVRRFREELGGGLAPRAALARAAGRTAPSIVFSGLTVAAGFLALLLVRIPLMHSLALGGAIVVVAAVCLTLTLLPPVLALLGEKVFWPFGAVPRAADGGRTSSIWSGWARFVARRPWLAVVPAAGVLAVLIAPVFWLGAWNPGAKDLPRTAEARQAADGLSRNFSTGWLGPIVLAFQAKPGESVRDAERQEAILATVARLSHDERIARVAPHGVSPDGEMALVALVPRHAPEHNETMALVRELRGDAWSAADSSGLRVLIGGASAGLADFDAELLGSLWRVVPVVLAVTFAMLLVMFRSILIPLKATLLNLASVLASWGFLVLVFQHGLGAGIIGLEPPGGLNAFIVIMLFTILFGLSMDYEVFLMSRIKEQRDAGADNATAVARGLQQAGGTVTSAALVMICIFASFAFTNLTATQEFGLGLAFAVLLDATLVRVVLLPALMHLLGDWNWWMPYGRR